MYHLIQHRFPDRVSGIPFSKLERAVLPGLEANGDVWARFDLRLPVFDEALLSTLEELLKGVHHVSPGRFSELKTAVMDAGLDPRWASMLDPGTQFGPPKLKVLKPKIWFDLYHEICSERFRNLALESSMTGLSFHPVQTIGRKPSTELFLVQAAFARLTEPDQADFEVSNPDLTDRRVRKLEDVAVVVPGKADFYRMPYMYSGLLVSDKGREFMETNELVTGVVFVRLKQEGSRCLEET